METLAGGMFLTRLGSIIAIAEMRLPISVFFPRTKIYDRTELNVLGKKMVGSTIVFEGNNDFFVNHVVKCPDINPSWPSRKLFLD